MLVFAAFVPHPLLSLQELGNQHTQKIRKTMRAFRALADELYAAQPDTIIVISPHVRSKVPAFTINQWPEIAVDFTEYGDLVDRLTLVNDIGFGYRIRESAETSMPVVLTDEHPVDYGIAIPLLHLTRNFKQSSIRVIAIGTSSLDLHFHYVFGSLINRHVQLATKRVAVIASGDLAHGVHRSAPGGYSPAAVSFNAAVQSAIIGLKTKDIVSLSSEQRIAVNECGIAPLTTLLGVLGERRYTPNILSYEASLGVGYLVVNYQVS